MSVTYEEPLPLDEFFEVCAAVRVCGREGRIFVAGIERWE